MSIESEKFKAPPGTQSVARTLTILECFLNHPDLGITEIAGLADLSPSTTHRIVRSLVARGYLDQNPNTDRYHLGRSAIVLGQAARSQRGLDLALPLLEKLGAETGESVNMGLLDHHDVVVVLRVSSVQPLRFDQPVGSRIAAHCSSMGKALMAFHPGPTPVDVTKMNLMATTEHTITSADELFADLDVVRERGYSTDHQESIIGVSCVGAPILDQRGNAVSAIAIQGPTVRMTPDRMGALGRRITEIATEIAQLIQPELH